MKAKDKKLKAKRQKTKDKAKNKTKNKSVKMVSGLGYNRIIVRRLRRDNFGLFAMHSARFAMLY